MSKSSDQQMAKLIKKTAAKAANKAKVRRTYDSTLPKREELDDETRAFFAEMKKREF
jgi:hypothetical protein